MGGSRRIPACSTVSSGVACLTHMTPPPPNPPHLPDLGPMPSSQSCPVILSARPGSTSPAHVLGCSEALQVGYRCDISPNRLKTGQDLSRGGQSTSEMEEST